jgi:ribosome maturation factor RimP
MVDIERIREFVEERLAGSDLFPVEARTLSGGEVEVVIDGDRGVTIDACVKLNRAIEAAFEGETDDMTLTVASAGIGRPLRLLRQYRKLTGRSVEVVFRSGAKVVAMLLDADETSVELKYPLAETVETASGKKKKVTIEVVERRALEEIKSTCEHIDFK